MQGLTEAQLIFFEREGYSLIPDVFTLEDLEPFKNDLIRIIDEEATQLHVEGILSNLYADEDYEHRLVEIARGNPQAASKIMWAIHRRIQWGYDAEGLFKIVTHSNLLAKLESLLGPEIIGSSTIRMRPKIPSYLEIPDMVSGVVPWHQDSAYFAPHCDKELILTCWIPLVDANRENGCLQVLPGVHKQGLFMHHVESFLVINEEERPPVEPITMEMPVGGVLIMTNRTPHQSTPNVTDTIRWSIDIRYQSADAPTNVGQTPEDYNPGLDPRYISCNPPEADFVVQSRKKPDTVIKNWQEFRRLRTSFHDREAASFKSKVDYTHSRQWPQQKPDKKKTHTDGSGPFDISPHYPRKEETDN